MTGLQLSGRSAAAATVQKALCLVVWNMVESSRTGIRTGRDGF